MTDKLPTLGRDSLPNDFQQLVPEDWQPSAPGEGVHPTTHAMAEAWFTFGTSYLRNYLAKEIPSGIPSRAGIQEPGDFVNEAIAGFLTQHADEPPPGAHPGYLFSIGVRRLKDAFRDVQRRPETLVDQYQDSHTGDSPAEQTLYHELQELAIGVVNDSGLEPKTKQAMEIAIRMPQLTPSEIAEALGISGDALRVTRTRLFHRIRRHLYEIGYTTPKRARLHAAPQSERGQKITDIQDVFLKQLTSTDGQMERAAYIPPYLGAWRTIGREVGRHLMHKNNFGGSVLVVHPDERRLPALRQMFGKITYRKAHTVRQTLETESPKLLTLDTPAAIADMPQLADIGYSYIVADAETADLLPPVIRKQATFILHVANRPEGMRSYPLYTAPSYEEAAAARPIKWRPEDSTSYLAEHRLQTGRQLTQREAAELAEAGQGPSLRRLCQNIGSFAALEILAGYEQPIESKLKRPVS